MRECARAEIDRTYEFIKSSGAIWTLRKIGGKSSPPRA